MEPRIITLCSGVALTGGVNYDSPSTELKLHHLHKDTGIYVLRVGGALTRPAAAVCVFSLQGSFDNITWVKVSTSDFASSLGAIQGPFPEQVSHATAAGYSTFTSGVQLFPFMRVTARAGLAGAVITAQIYDR